LNGGIKSHRMLGQSTLSTNINRFGQSISKFRRALSLYTIEEDLQYIISCTWFVAAHLEVAVEYNTLMS